MRCPVLAADVLRHAEGLAIPVITLRRAKLRVGVLSSFLSEGDRAGGKWSWSLPPAA